MGRWFTLTVAWYRGEDWGPANGYTRGDGENLSSFKIGPLAICWGLDGEKL